MGRSRVLRQDLVGLIAAAACVVGVIAPSVAEAHDDPAGTTQSEEEHARTDLAGVPMSTVEAETARAARARTPAQQRAQATGMRRAEAQAPAGGRGVAGAWAAPVATPVVPIFQAVLPDGAVLMWDSVGDKAVEDYPGTQDFTRAMVWDPATGKSVRTDLQGYNIFCAGYTQLPNGDVLVVGGNKNDDIEGIRQTHLFHWRTRTWTRGPDMDAERWYPSVAALSDGEAAIIGGGTGVAEVYQSDGTLRSLTGLQTYSDRTYYPMLAPREDGRLELIGPGPLATIDPGGAGTLDAAQDRDGISRTYGSFATYLPGQTLVTGGGDIVGSDGLHRPASSSVVVDTAESATSVRPAAAMAFPRRQHNLTLLADGSALATGGMSRAEESTVDLDHPVLAAERWDPATDTWTTLAAASRIREYHSSASLLPDGRVLTGGGGVCVDCVEKGYLEKNLEVFSPPYLFDDDGSLATRPRVRGVPATVAIGDTFTATVSSPSSIRSLGLVRLGAPTHGVDQGQRYVPLRFSTAGRTLTARAPTSAASAPPGYYMLFAVDAAGVPSVASMVKVTSALAPPLVDLARGRKTVQSSTFDEADGTATGAAAHAVDGNTAGAWKGQADTVTHTALSGDDQPWWQVDLGAPRTIRGVELWNRTDCCTERLSGSVFVSRSDMRGRSFQELRADGTVTEIPFTPPSGPNRSLHVGGVTARYVRVQLIDHAPLHLAEVRVLGDDPSWSGGDRPTVDLALRRPARQSSTAAGGRATRAVDGDTDGRWPRGSVTRTAIQDKPWWQVDLGVVRDVSTVRVWNRSDCCARRLQGARVLLSTRDMRGRSWAALKRDPRVAERRIGAGRTSTVRGVRARYVRIQSPRRTSLALAEVQALGRAS